MSENTSNGKSDIIVLSGVGKSFWRGKERLDVLKDLDLRMKEGSFEALMGPSGSGKSTLLNLIAGLDQADDGTGSGEGAEPAGLVRRGGGADDHGGGGAARLPDLADLLGLPASGCLGAPRTTRAGRRLQLRQQRVEASAPVLRMDAVRDDDRGSAAGPVQLGGECLEQQGAGGGVALDGDQPWSGGQVDVDTGVVRHADLHSCPRAERKSRDRDLITGIFFF